VVLGLTATPYRADGAALGDVFDDLVEVTTVPELIDAGHIVEPRVFGRKAPDLTGVRTVAGDYNLGQLADVMNRAELVGDLVETWRERASGRLTVVFAVDVAHSRHIATAFLKAGIPAGHVDGRTPEAERAAVLARLAAGEVRVLANCAILTEGWDLPACSCVVLARPTKSRSLWKQMCGRALRPAPEVGKCDCLILDHAGCWERHGFLTDPEQFSLEGKEPLESSAPRCKCPQCGAELPGWPRFCPECEAPLPRRRPMTAAAEESPGELEEIRPLEELVGFYEHLATIARDRGYQAVWVGIKFRDRYGYWPHRRHMGEDPRLVTRMEEVSPGQWKRVWLVDEGTPNRRHGRDQRGAAPSRPEILQNRRPPSRPWRSAP
jgi:superfamily II DNA or RNA helicase